MNEDRAKGRRLPLLLVSFLSACVPRAPSSDPVSVDLPPVSPSSPELVSAGMPRLVLQSGHSGLIDGAAFDPEERLLVTSSGHELILWDMTSRLARGSIRIDDGSDMFIEANGATLVTSASSNVNRWSLHSGDLVDTFSTGSHAWSVHPLAKGGILVVSDGGPRTWLGEGPDPESRKFSSDGECGRVASSRYPFSSSALSPGGDLLLTCHDHASFIWDIRTGKCSKIIAHKDVAHARCIGFAPEGAAIVLRTYNGISVRDVEKGTQTAFIPIERPRYSDSQDKIALSPDGSTIATSTALGHVRLWTTTTGDPLYEILSSGSIHVLEFAPGGRMLGIAADTTKLWNLNTESEVQLASSPAYKLAFSPSGRWLVAMLRNQPSHVWDLLDMSAHIAIGGHERQARHRGLHHTESTRALASDGTVVQATSHGIQSWDVHQGRLVATIEPKHRPTEVLFHAEHNLVVFHDKTGAIEAWDVDPVRFRFRHEDEGYQYCFNIGERQRVDSYVESGGTYILFRDCFHRLLVFDSTSGAIRRELDARVLQTNNLSISPSVRFLVAEDYTKKAEGLSVFDVRSGKRIGTLPKRTNTSMPIFGPDGASFLTWEPTGKGAKGSIVRLPSQDVTSELELQGKRFFDSFDNPTRYAPDGVHVVIPNVEDASGHDQDVVIWNTTNGSERRLRGHTDFVTKVIFSPDGQLIATEGRDDRIMVWEAATGRLKRNLDIQRNQHAHVRSMTFSPDGRLLLVEESDLTRIWNLDTGKLVHSFEDRGQAIFIPPPEHPNSTAMTFVLSGQQGPILTRFDDSGNEETIRLAAHDIPGIGHATLAYTENGLFSGDDAMFRSVGYRVGSDLLEDDVVPAEALYEYFYRPDLMSDFWSGRPIEVSRVVRDGVGRVPRVEFVDLPEGPMEQDRIAVKVRARNRGGGVADIRLYNNGAPVLPHPNTDDRGMYRTKVEGASDQESVYERVFDVWLEQGRKNVLVAEAISELGRVVGPACEQVIEHVGRAPPPNLHMVAVSLERYEDPSMGLKYAHEDAEAFVQAFRTQEGRLFGNVLAEPPLQDGLATLEGIEAALRRVAERARPQDSFMFFFAGHGQVEDCGEGSKDEYHLMTYRAALSTPKKTCADALGTQHLKVLIREIKANKKLLFLDACQAGRVVDEMSERGAREERALRNFARMEGLAIFAGSGEQETAIEYDALRHGAFTYVLLDGLLGKAKEEEEHTIFLFELAGHLDRELQALGRRFGRDQAPRTWLPRDNYPVYIVEPDDAALLKALKPAR